MIVSICNEKGGSGKSTLAINLAMYSKKMAGDDFVLVDSDPQRSVATFINIRTNENHPKGFDFCYKSGNELGDYISKNQNRNLLIDTGGRDSKEMRIALIKSDIVVIPTIPSQIDVSVLDKMVSLVKMAKEANEKLKIFIAINKANTNPFLQKNIVNLQNYIKDLECDYIKLCQQIIYERQSYKVAFQLGISVVEAKEKFNKSYMEIKNLYNEILSKN